jgi:hypothetical protein
MLSAGDIYVNGLKKYTLETFPIGWVPAQIGFRLGRIPFAIL